MNARLGVAGGAIVLGGIVVGVLIARATAAGSEAYDKSAAIEEPPYEPPPPWPPPAPEPDREAAAKAAAPPPPPAAPPPAPVPTAPMATTVETVTDARIARSEVRAGRTSWKGQRKGQRKGREPGAKGSVLAKETSKSRGKPKLQRPAPKATDGKRRPLPPPPRRHERPDTRLAQASPPRSPSPSTPPTPPVEPPVFEPPPAPPPAPTATTETAPAEAPDARTRPAMPVTISLRDDLAGLLKLASIEMHIDGRRVVSEKSREGIEAQAGRIVHRGQLAPGLHELEVHLDYKGDGGPVFSYMEGYTFRLKRKLTFTVPESGTAQLVVTGVDRGAGYEFQDRPDLRLTASTTR